MDDAEGRSDRERARAYLVDRVALRAVRAHEIESALFGGASALCSGRFAEKHQGKCEKT